MMPFIYLAILIAWTILIVGFVFKDYAISALGSIFLMSLGVYILINGIETFANNHIAILTLGFVHIGVGAYVFIRGAYELYKGD